MDKRIVTLTLNPALDKITGISHVSPNKKLRCSDPQHEAGGGGINVSRAIHRLGGESLAIFPSGGPNGEVLKAKLEEESIQYQPLPIDGSIRENITIFESSAKQQFRFIMPGPKLTEDECKNVLTLLEELEPSPDYLVVSGSTPKGVSEDFYADITTLANEMNCRVIVDTSGAHLKRAAKAGVYLLKPNMRELANLSGNTIESETHQVEAAQEIIDGGQAEVIVVSQGAGGALLVTEGKREQLRTPTVAIRSKLGAGDSMVAGIIMKLAQGESIRDATLYGIAAGAATVSTEGTELCNKSDTDRLYEILKQNENE
jgi:6-phosphofructokinase 2